MIHGGLSVGVVIGGGRDLEAASATVQSIYLLHPEVREQTCVTLVGTDLHDSTRSALRSFPGLRDLPFAGVRGVDDLVTAADGAAVMCCVSAGVLLAPGGLAAVLRYFDGHPGCMDLVHGPRMALDLTAITASHLDAGWESGCYGRPAVDPRADDVDGEPFEIPAHSMAVFACRPGAWPVTDERIRGLDGLEGVVHEKVRRAGGRCLCVPALRWVDEREAEVTPDRVRNYRIGWRELGWSADEVDQGVRETAPWSIDTAAMLESTARQLTHPLNAFDAALCLNVDAAVDRWAAARRRLEGIDFLWRVERYPAIVEEDHHIGCTMSWRGMIAESTRRAYRNVVVFEDDVLFLDTALAVLEQALVELGSERWDLLYLGGCVWAQTFPFLDGCRVLQECGPVTASTALVVNGSAFAQVLADIPEVGDPRLPEWFDEWRAIDQYLSRRVADGTFRALITFPRVATQPGLLHYPDADLAFADRYVI